MALAQKIRQADGILRSVPEPGQIVYGSAIFLFLFLLFCVLVLIRLTTPPVGFYISFYFFCRNSRTHTYRFSDF